LRRVFDLAVEHLCAQFSSAADFALSQPDRYAELLLALAGPAQLASIDLLAPPVDVTHGRIRRQPAKPANDQAFARVAEGTRAGIDLLQISVGQQWRRTVRAAAVLLSGLFGAFGALLVNHSVSSRLLYTLHSGRAGFRRVLRLGDSRPDRDSRTAQAVIRRGCRLGRAFRTDPRSRRSR
jgi:hypothetical protein